MRVIGHRFSKDSHDVRDFLARNRVPARWLDVERDGEARELLAVAGVDADRLPVALLEDGSILERPTTLELAERLGISAQPVGDHYDLVIVGGGPAGLAAAVYGASEGLRTVMVEREAPGGQAGQSSRIENYLGLPGGVVAARISRAARPIRRAGSEPSSSPCRRPSRSEVEGAGRLVELTGGGVLSANTVLVASGVSYRQLDAPGFAELTGAGIYYGAALTEARACADQHVVVIGGANSAGQAAVYFSGYAGRVTMLVRGDSLAKSMSHYLIEQIAALPNVEVRTGRRPSPPRARTAICERCGSGRRTGPRRSRTSTRASCSSAPRRGPTGSRASSRATSAGSSSRAPTSATTAGRCRASRTCSRRASRACSSPATCACARSSGSRAPSERARWPSR